MKAVIQRVTHANIKIQDKVFEHIGAGLLVFIGIEKEDTNNSIEPKFQKILHYRVFNDQDNKMNLNVTEINGEILLVPQFTIVSNTKKGLRPTFSNAAKPHCSKNIFNHLVNFAKTSYTKTQSGCFGADMQIELCNDGPVTFILE